MLRFLIAVSLITFVLLTAACSAVSLGYSALPGLGVFTLDRYFDFDETQREFVRGGLNDLQAWHRKQELPEYRRILLSIKQRNQKNLTPADLEWFRGELSQRYAAVAEKSLPQIAQLALTAKPAQLQKMRNRLADQNKETREKYLQPNIAKRNAERLKRSVDRFEDYVGSLREEQKKMIDETLQQVPSTDESWYEDRLQRQKQISDLLEQIRREQPTKETAAKLLRDYLARTTEPADAKNAGYYDRALKMSDDMTLKLFASLDQKQRQALDKKIDSWIADIDGLMR
jgi:hypothetical protein